MTIKGSEFYCNCKKLIEKLKAKRYEIKVPWTRTPLSAAQCLAGGSLFKVLF